MLRFLQSLQQTEREPKNDYPYSVPRGVAQNGEPPLTPYEIALERIWPTIAGRMHREKIAAEGGPYESPAPRLGESQRAFLLKHLTMEKREEQRWIEQAERYYYDRAMNALGDDEGEVEQEEEKDVGGMREGRRWSGDVVDFWVTKVERKLREKRFPLWSRDEVQMAVPDDRTRMMQLKVMAEQREVGRREWNRAAYEGNKRKIRERTEREIAKAKRESRVESSPTRQDARDQRNSNLSSDNAHRRARQPEYSINELLILCSI